MQENMIVYYVITQYYIRLPRVLLEVCDTVPTTQSYTVKSIFGWKYTYINSNKFL